VYLLGRRRGHAGQLTAQFFGPVRSPSLRARSARRRGKIRHQFFHFKAHEAKEVGIGESDFVRQSTPRGTSSRRQCRKCSRVCGLMDSSAAITKSTKIDSGPRRRACLDEALVAGHINEAEPQRGAVAGGAKRGRW